MSVIQVNQSGLIWLLVSVLCLMNNSGQASEQGGSRDNRSPAGWQTNRNRACFDTSRHIKHRVQVEPGVFVEVLDWGGKGEPLILLSGLGNTAHIYDDFAYQFTDRFRVLGITRRGFGDSSKPLEGYDLATRARDDLKVLDYFKIRKAHFAGHSIAGTELFYLGSYHADRVKKIVTLDSYDNLANLPPLPDLGELAAVTERPSDTESPQHYEAAQARWRGFRTPISEDCNSSRFSRKGAFLNSRTPNEVVAAILTAAGGKAAFNQIKVPALGFFANPTAEFPAVAWLDPLRQAEWRRMNAAARPFSLDVIARFRTEIPQVEVVEIPHAGHEIFITHEAQVVERMRAFLLKP